MGALAPYFFGGFMNSYVVWLDQKEAKFFELAPGGVKKDHLNKKVTLHHNSSQEKSKGGDKFFHELAEYLNKRAKEILLLGPGTAKDQFMGHLKEHHHQNLANRVVGVLAADHPTDGQILAEARKFFVHYDAFN